MRTATRVPAFGALGVAILGATLGGYLALPAEMSAPRHAPTAITGRDPNYVAYLRMLASLGPAPARRAATPHARPAIWWEVETRRPRAEAEERWIEVVDEDIDQAVAPPARGWTRYQPEVVADYAGPQVEAYPYEPPRRAAESYRPAPWRVERTPPPVVVSGVYGRGWGSDEPTPPPPPRPSGY